MQTSTLAARETDDGWVIDATKPDGSVDQLIGVYSTEDVAVNWIAQHPPSWWRVYQEQP